MHHLNALAAKLQYLRQEYDETVMHTAFASYATTLSPRDQSMLAALVCASQDSAQQPVGHNYISNDGCINGVVVGLNLGRIVYGREPEEDERRSLVWYLSQVAAELQELPLRGLDDRLAAERVISAPDVYVMLASERTCVFERDPALLLSDFFTADQWPILKPSYAPEYQLPDKAITKIEPLADDTVRTLRATLVSEEVAQQRCLVLLGDPGSGKSTFVRHMAWALAQRGLDQHSAATEIYGWSDQQRLFPLIISLRDLAASLARHSASPQTLYGVLRTALERFNLTAVDSLLNEGLTRGTALVLLDGLDEVPLEALAGQTVDRMTVLRVVRDFLLLHPQARAVLTCRTRAFTAKLRECLRWPTTTIQPFTFGQIRHFASAWFDALAKTGRISPNQAQPLRDALVNTIAAQPTLRSMAQTPLLLTLMALVLLSDGSLPRDRPLLYERILELLMGRWDKIRFGQSLGEAIGLPGWTSSRLRPLLDELSYTIHAAASAADGRGWIKQAQLRDTLIAFFEAAQVENPWEAARKYLAYMEQRSGLLVLEQDRYVFAHLTLQEHCAGRHLVSGLDASERVLNHRTDDRWHEPILLGLGVMQRHNPLLLDRVLSDLLDCDECGAPKPQARWQRDLLLAAEIGADRDWRVLRAQHINTERLLRDLKAGLGQIITCNPPILRPHERVRAAELLGHVGDPRPGVCTLQPDWCFVPYGSFIYGGFDGEPSALAIDLAGMRKPSSGFVIARYPVTEWQYQQFIQSTSYDQHQLHGSGHPNRPMRTTVWLALEFCSWLTEQGHQAGWLLPHQVVRLPTMWEWQKAGEAVLTTALELDTATTAALGAQSLPVGCFVERESVYGVLDINACSSEWTMPNALLIPTVSVLDDHVADLLTLNASEFSDDLHQARCMAHECVAPAQFGRLLAEFRMVISEREPFVVD